MKEDIKKKIDDIRKGLISKGADAKLIDELIRLQKEYDVVPTEVDIPVDEVVKRYAVTDAWEIVRCKTAIFFHTNSFWIISRPTLANNLQGGALYEMLSWFCDYQDVRDSVTGDERVDYDTVCDMMCHIFSLPLDVFTDMDFCIDVATDILNRRKEYFARLEERMNTPHEDTVEDLSRNAAFEQEYLQGEAMGREIVEMAQKKNARKKQS